MWALRPLGTRWARDARRGTRARAVAAVRLGLLLIVEGIALFQLIASSSGLTQPLRSAAWVTCTLFAFPWFANSVAGLWLVSPFVSAGPGDDVVACGQPGRIAGYDIVGLELETDTGWTARLAYLTAALRPFLISPQKRARTTGFTLRKPNWTPDEVSFIRQAAILAPFRDLSSPVTISQSEGVVTIHLALSRPEAHAQMARLLDGALPPNRSHEGSVERDGPQA